MIELTQYTAISNKPTAIEQVLISVDRLMATFPYVIRINRNEVPNIIRALGPVAYGVTDNSASFLPPHLRPTPPVQDTVIDSEIRHLHEEIKRMQLTNGEMFKRIGILESQMSSTGDRLDSQFQEIATVINGNDAAINAITEDTGNIKERINHRNYLSNLDSKYLQHCLCWKWIRSYWRSWIDNSSYRRNIYCWICSN